MRTPFMKHALAGALAVSLAAGGAVVAQAALTKTPSEVTAGAYDLDSGHGKITWSVNHLGFSTYTGQFVNVKAELKLDVANPSASTLTATIPLTDVAPNDDKLKAHLQTADFFDTAKRDDADRRRSWLFRIIICRGMRTRRGRRGRTTQDALYAPGRAAWSWCRAACAIAAAREALGRTLVLGRRSSCRVRLCRCRCGSGSWCWIHND